MPSGVFLLGCSLLLVLGAVCAEDPFRRGVRAYEQGEYEQARTLLRGVFRRTPAHVDEERGSSAYWLGKAYEACNQPDSMQWAWREGVNALNEAGRFDARLFDAYLWTDRQRTGEDRERAIKAYVTLVGYVGETETTAERSILRRHVAQVLPLLTVGQLDRLFVDGVEAGEPETWTFRKEAGEWLASWWRRQDPIPSTGVNERVEEHLSRVAIARSKFSSGNRLEGWDDRGDLYVRYGSPALRDSISFTDAQFHREVVRLGVGVHRGDFPANEIWSYPHVGEKGHYLFVRRKGGYRLGQVMDLLPRKLKGNFHAGDRSMNRAYSSMAALRYIYRSLSVQYRMNANVVYESVANYWVSQDAMEAIMSLRGGGAQGASVGSGVGERTVYQSVGPEGKSLSAVANEAVQRSRHQQRTFVRKRRKEMPREYSEVATAETALPVEFRTARFLNEQGETRTEVFWGGEILGEEGADRQIVNVSLVEYAPRYRQKGTQSQQHLFEGRNVGRSDVQIAPEVIATGSETDPYHLAIQWDRYGVASGSETTQLGRRTGRQIVRIDSLRPLSTDSRRLEMSDLRPMVPSGQQFTAATPTEEATPYPFSSLTVDTPLLLYFEVYHLAYAAQDQTRYEVAYEVQRTTEDTGVLGLFGGPDVERTETSSTYTGSRRRASEAILLDWDGASSDAAQSVTITVHVTDETSGQTVDRSINFQVMPPAGE